MNLQVFPPEFFLLSSDPQCLQFMAACKFCASPVTLRASFRPWSAATGDYPVFTHNGTTITEYHQLVDYLKKHGGDVVLDSHLSDGELTDAYAYSCLIKHSLMPAMAYTLWIDALNVATVTNRLAAQQIAFPLNMRYVQRRKRQALDAVMARFPGDHITMADVEYSVTREAITCINQLAAKLGEQKYFYGDKPSSLDAEVFGLIAVLLKHPLPNDRLQQHVKACSNLTRFVEAICTIYMPLDHTLSSVAQSKMLEWEVIRHHAQQKARADQQHSNMHKNARSKSSETDTSDDYKMRDKIFFGVGALMLSLVAAIHFGIVQVQLFDGKDEEGREDYTIS